MTVLASIWAQDRNGVIGDGKNMLWHVPADFKHFKKETLGCPVIMGRSSFEALGKPLPGRANIVLTRNPNYRAAGVLLASSLAQAIEMARLEAKNSKTQTIWITGGAHVYAEAMSIVDELVVTYLDIEVAASEERSTLAIAPTIDEAIWRVDESRTDSEWRPQSGDAKWRVTTYVRR